MNNDFQDDIHFERLADESQAGLSDSFVAPSRLKSRVYSALIERQQESGPLQGLDRIRASGSRLCVFEQLVRITPVGDSAKSFNYCRICHARVLGERVENAPIYWGNCPYVGFQNR